MHGARKENLFFDLGKSSKGKEKLKMFCCHTKMMKKRKKKKIVTKLCKQIIENILLLKEAMLKEPC